MDVIKNNNVYDSHLHKIFHFICPNQTRQHFKYATYDVRMYFTNCYV